MRADQPAGIRYTRNIVNMHKIHKSTDQFHRRIKIDGESHESCLAITLTMNNHLASNAFFIHQLSLRLTGDDSGPSTSHINQLNYDLRSAQMVLVIQFPFNGCGMPLIESISYKWLFSLFSPFAIDMPTTQWITWDGCNCDSSKSCLIQEKSLIVF